MSSRSDKHIQLDRQDLLTIKIPVKEGKLYHQNGTKWSRCHVILGKHTLYVFDINHRADEEFLSLRIKTSDIIKVDLHGEIMKESICFVVVYGEDNIIVFACDSEVTQTDWMKAFTEVIQNFNHSADSDFCSGGSLHTNTIRKENDYDEIEHVEDENRSQKVTYGREDTVESEPSCVQPDTVYSRVIKKSSVTEVDTPNTPDAMINVSKNVIVPHNELVEERVHELGQVTYKINKEQRAKGNTKQEDSTYASVPDFSDHINVKGDKGSFERGKRDFRNRTYDQIESDETGIKVIDDSGSHNTGDSERKASHLSPDRSNIDDKDVQMEDLKSPIQESDPVNNNTDELKNDQSLCGNVFDVNSLIGDSNCPSTPNKAHEKENETKRDPEKQSCAQKETKLMKPPLPKRPSLRPVEPPGSTVTRQGDSKHAHANVGINTHDDTLNQDKLETESKQSSSDEDYPSYESTNSMTFEKEEYMCEKLNKSLLRSKPVGTFCVCKSRETQELAVKTDNGDNISKFRIMEENGDFFLKKDTKFQSLDELLKCYSDEYLPSKKFKITLKQGCFRKSPCE